VENSQVFGNEIKEAKTEKEKVDLAKKKSDAEKQALKLFQLALSLRSQSEEPVPIDLVNRIRHVMCYLNFQQQNYYDAAVIGEFLAQRFPAAPGSKQAAKIALACYVYTFNVPGNKTPQFDIGQMEKLSKLIVDRWKGEPEADEALMKLADIYLNSGRIDEAIAALGQITDASPIRPLANTKAGHALWSQYIRQSKSIDGPLPPEIAKLRTDAETMLKKGIPEMRKQVNAENPPNLTLLTSEVSLAQLYIETGRAPEAIKLLELKPMGLLEMAAHESTKDSGVLRGETFKSGLRAYVSVGRPDDAEKMMNSLDKEYQNEDAAKLTRIYVTLGRELERQLGEMPEDKTKERATLLDSFERFLSRITQRSQGNTYATLNWIAETFYGLGKGTERGGQPTPESKKYFGKAVDAYMKILVKMEESDAAAKNPNDPTQVDKSKLFGPVDSEEAPNARDQTRVRLRVRLANCTRRMGDFKNAAATLQKLIAANPTMLEAQLEAAYTYQAWGLVDPTKYKEAISGVMEGPKRVVWGWAHMSQIMQKAGAKNPAMMHYFHEARFNLNRCRQLRSAAKPADEKKKDLEGTEADIMVIARLYPDLGGPDWAPLYKKLFAEVRTALNKTGTLESEMAKMTKPATPSGTATAPEGKQPNGGQ
jgi:tetratricopeptide (TPR) repeat protein